MSTTRQLPTRSDMLEQAQDVIETLRVINRHKLECPQCRIDDDLRFCQTNANYHRSFQEGFQRWDQIRRKLDELEHEGRMPVESLANHVYRA